jgi:hypothetical protein
LVLLDQLPRSDESEIMLNLFLLGIARTLYRVNTIPKNRLRRKSFAPFFRYADSIKQ